MVELETARQATKLALDAETHAYHATQQWVQVRSLDAHVLSCDFNLELSRSKLQLQGVPEDRADAELTEEQRAERAHMASFSDSRGKFLEIIANLKAESALLAGVAPMQH